MKWFNKKQRQTTYCYCPICDNELVGSDSFVHDKPDDVRYVCSNCGCESSWNFDIAPAPILMKAQRLTKNIYKYENCGECGEPLRKRMRQLTEHVFEPEENTIYRTHIEGVGYKMQTWKCDNGHKWARKTKVAI